MAVAHHQLSAAPIVLIDENRMLGFGVAGGLLLFVVVTGCAVWLLPFGVVAQACLLLHVVVGIIGGALFAVWQLRHWLAGRDHPLTFRKTCAYVGFWLLVASAVTGLVESWQALFGRYVSSARDSLHLWTSLCALPLLAIHAWPVKQAQAGGGDEGFERCRAWRLRSWATAAMVTVVLSGAWGVLAAYYTRAQNADRARQRVGRDACQSDLLRNRLSTSVGPGHTFWDVTCVKVCYCQLPGATNQNRTKREQNDAQTSAYAPSFSVIAIED
jgi:hypothetical protein